LQCVAVCCSVLQCVAVCCSVLQCVAVHCSVLQCAAVRCSVLQCVAVWCSAVHVAIMRDLTQFLMLYITCLSPGGEDLYTIPGKQNCMNNSEFGW